ncbi:MAG: dTMP kinase [Patescibacteria group bacterium]
MSRSKKGKFIVIDGGDGVGKGAAIEFLKEKFAGQPVIFTREPGATAAGERLREILLADTSSFNPLFELLLFAADRVDHLTRIVRPALRAGHNVVCDRFAGSTFAYQIVANQCSDLRPIFQILHDYILADTKPDLYLILDLDPKIAARRIKSRGQPTTGFDEQSPTYHRRVRRGFLEYVKNRPHKIIDASQSLAQVQTEVWQAARQALNLKS